MDDTTLTDLVTLAHLWGAHVTLTGNRSTLTVAVQTRSGGRTYASGKGPTLRVAARECLFAMRALDAQERGAA